MDENIENKIEQLEKQFQRTEMHIYRRMDALEEVFNENPDRVNQAFDEVDGQMKYLRERQDFTDKSVNELKEVFQRGWNAQEDRARITNEQVDARMHGLEEQIFALGKLAENLAERMRRQEQNWNLAKKQMQLLQIQINKVLPDEDKLPPDWLDQIEMVREVINLHLNTSEKTETEVQND